MSGYDDCPDCEGPRSYGGRYKPCVLKRYAVNFVKFQTDERGRLSIRITIETVAEVDFVKPVSALKFFQMTWLSKPVPDRLIYRLIKKRQIKSIVEFGLGGGDRCSNMIAVANKFSPDSRIKYTGVDLFDARDQSESPLKLIEMHRKLNTADAKTQLVPGNLSSALPRIANGHVRTDMVIISAGFEEDELDSTSMFLPRMLHPNSVVLIQDYKDEEFYVHSRLEIEKMVTQSATTANAVKKAA